MNGWKKTPDSNSKWIIFCSCNGLGIYLSHLFHLPTVDSITHILAIKCLERFFDKRTEWDPILKKIPLLSNLILNLNLILNVKNISIGFPNKFNFTIEKTAYTAYNVHRFYIKIHSINHHCSQALLRIPPSRLYLTRIQHNHLRGLSVKSIELTHTGACIEIFHLCIVNAKTDVKLPIRGPKDY